MNINQAAEGTVRVFNQDPTIPICWVGGAGIGKTTMAREIVQELKGVKHFIYAPVRTDDAIGLNLPNQNRSMVEFTPHERMRKAIKEPCLIYIDEVNRADRYSRAAIMELVGERTVGGHPIHPKSVVLMTMNHEGEDYDVAEMDVAFKTRVVAVPVHADAITHAKWAHERGYTSMASYLNNYPNTINEEISWNRPRPDPRMLANLNRFINCMIDPTINNEVADFNLGKEFADDYYLVVDADEAQARADAYEQMMRNNTDSLSDLTHELVGGAR